ncbi:hypothetical protein [Mycoplasma sp. 3686d]|uniref:hypothetical protein n=1 Tax=Mycoplasma sp. 3686d TaxID=2967300 RepID=UPI00211BAF4F|nr:hypothetical protein [Mycoplasma sp. 3686d]UUM24864.1 hypothetical protein NPA12_00355 [Mycoplasma sp. 3686d]
MKRKYKRLINLSAIFTLGAIASVSIIYANKTSIKKNDMTDLKMQNLKLEIRFFNSNRQIQVFKRLIMTLN